MKKIFITRKINAIAAEILGVHYDVHSNKLDRALEPQELFKLVRDYDGILSMPTDMFNKEVLMNKKNTCVISNFAVGLDNIDIIFAREMGITVFNTPDVVTNSTADHVFSLLLEFSRKTSKAYDYIKSGKWKNWDPDIFIGEEYSGKTLGIIGFGRIGQAVARRAIGFGFKMVYYDLYDPIICKDVKKNIKRVSFNEILKISDYISIHVPLNNNTNEFISLREFKKMEKKPVFINTSRGNVVNTNDLVMAIKNKLIRAALLDVCNPEPINPNHELLSFPNCLLTPHIGTATKETRYNMAKLAAENIVNFFNNE